MKEGKIPPFLKEGWGGLKFLIQFNKGPAFMWVFYILMLEKINDSKNHFITMY